MRLERRKWLTGLGLTSLGTLILLSLLAACISSFPLIDATGNRRVFAGLSGLGLITVGFGAMVAGTADTDLQSAETRRCLHCQAICVSSAQFCSNCGQSQPT